jgi:cell division protein FtsN
MPRNEDGEFELVLGNRQLLSVFFIVVVLLGVFFTMGYIMGRSGSSSVEMTKVDNAPTPSPIVVDSGRPSAAPTQKAELKPAAKTEPPPEPKKPEKTEPQKPEPKKPEKPELPKPEPPKAAEAKKPEPPKAVPAGDAPAGNYLQVSAVPKADAEAQQRKLAQKGFRAYLQPYNDVVRVLVGPARDKAHQAELLDALKAEGFKPFARKL